MIKTRLTFWLTPKSTRLMPQQFSHCHLHIPAADKLECGQLNQHSVCSITVQLPRLPSFKSNHEKELTRSIGKWITLWAWHESILVHVTFLLISFNCGTLFFKGWISSTTFIHCFHLNSTLRAREHIPAFTVLAEFSQVNSVKRDAFFGI